MNCTCQHDSACSSCKPSLLERQEEVVRALQNLVLKFGTAPSGQLKDMAIALGVAVDKYVALRPTRPANYFGGWQGHYAGSINRAVKPNDQNPLPR